MASKSEPPNTDAPDSSSEILLSSMKKSMHGIPVLTEADVNRLESEDDEPESMAVSLVPTTDSMRAKQIAAWNTMSENMVKVVQTIRKNEERQAEGQVQANKRARKLAGAVYLALVLGAVVIGGIALSIYSQVSDMQEQLTVMKSQQDATLIAVNALSDALAKKIEAETTMDPQAEVEAAKAAVNAQKRALEASKQSAPTAAKRAEVDRKLKQVHAKELERKRDEFE